VLGDADKVKWVPLNAQQRFTALQSGEVDVLSRNTTWTLTRDASLGLHFTGVTYYDGQGFMVPEEQDQERQAAEERHGLRAVRHHDREEPDRLLQAPTT
jgi:ABC-type amino acid transport substrate-binding protein